jgi:predicted DNA-binding protein (MmcQ/YjbR family)
MFDMTLNYCLAFPAVTQEEKWDEDLRFSVGEKLFCMVCKTPPHQVSLKCRQEDFHRLISFPGIVPAPYLARYHWVQIKSLDTLPVSELQSLLQNAYDLVVSTLPPEERAKIQKERV